MRQEKFKMERQGLINVGDEIEISEYQSFMNTVISLNRLWQCPAVIQMQNASDPEKES